MLYVLMHVLRRWSPGKAHPSVELECDCYMAATGRYPNTTEIGLERAGVILHERTKHLETEEGRYQCAGAPTIFGAGDVLGPPGLASTGVEQAKAAIAEALHTTSSLHSMSTLPTRNSSFGAPSAANAMLLGGLPSYNLCWTRSEMLLS